MAEIAIERFFASGGDAVIRARHATIETFAALDVAGVFELARVHAEIAVAGLQDRLELVEGQPFVHRERRDDAEAKTLVNDAIEIVAAAEAGDDFER